MSEQATPPDEMTAYRLMVLKLMRDGVGAYHDARHSQRAARTRALNWLRAQGMVTWCFSVTEKGRGCSE